MAAGVCFPIRETDLGEAQARGCRLFQVGDKTGHGAGDEHYRMNGAGEMLVILAANFVDFRKPRPDLTAAREQELTQVVLILPKA